MQIKKVSLVIEYEDDNKNQITISSDNHSEDNTMVIKKKDSKTITTSSDQMKYITEDFDTRFNASIEAESEYFK